MKSRPMDWEGQLCFDVPPVPFERGGFEFSMWAEHHGDGSWYFDDLTLVPWQDRCERLIWNGCPRLDGVRPFVPDLPPTWAVVLIAFLILSIGYIMGSAQWKGDR